MKLCEPTPTANQPNLWLRPKGNWGWCLCFSCAPHTGSFEPVTSEEVGRTQEQQPALMQWRKTFTSLGLKGTEFKLGDCGRTGFRQPVREMCLMSYRLLGKFGTKKYLQGKWIFSLLWKKLKQFRFVLSSPIWNSLMISRRPSALARTDAYLSSELLSLILHRRFNADYCLRLQEDTVLL